MTKGCPNKRKSIPVRKETKSPNTNLPIRINEHSTVFIKEDGSPVCETGIIEYWKLVNDDTDSRYVVKYGWHKDILFLIDSSGTEHDVGRFLRVDGPKNWRGTSDCTFIKYYPSGLFLVKSHEKYGFAILREKQADQIPYQYDSIEEVDDLLFRVEVNGLFGLLDNTGKEIAPPKYCGIDIQELRTFTNVIVYDDSLSLRGYSYSNDSDLYRVAVLDRTGKEIIPPIQYKCISRFRYNQELEHPLFVVSSDNRVMKSCIGDDQEIELEWGSYRGEKLVTPQWGIVNPTIGEIIPQNFEQFSIIGDKDKPLILCRCCGTSVLFDFRGAIVMGFTIGVSLFNDCIILSWYEYRHCIIDKDLKLILNDSSSIQIEKGVLMCTKTIKPSSDFWDDYPEYITELKQYPIPDSAWFRGSIYEIEELINRIC